MPAQLLFRGQDSDDPARGQFINSEIFVLNCRNRCFAYSYFIWDNQYFNPLTPLPTFLIFSSVLASVDCPLLVSFRIDFLPHLNCFDHNVIQTYDGKFTAYKPSFLKNFITFLCSTFQSLIFAHFQLTRWRNSWNCENSHSSLCNSAQKNKLYTEYVYLFFILNILKYTFYVSRKVHIFMPFFFQDFLFCSNFFLIALLWISYQMFRNIFLFA